MQTVKFKKLHPSAPTPSYAKEGDAGVDLTATRIINETPEQIVYGTGIAVEIPSGYVGLIFPRSSVRGYNLSLSNSVGVIDAGYRGEIQVSFNKLNMDPKVYGIGDRVCQIMIMPFPHISYMEVEELSTSERGTEGHGSTGVSTVTNKAVDPNLITLTAPSNGKTNTGH